MVRDILLKSWSGNGRGGTNALFMNVRFSVAPVYLTCRWLLCCVLYGKSMCSVRGLPAFFFFPSPIGCAAPTSLGGFLLLLGVIIVGISRDP